VHQPQLVHERHRLQQLARDRLDDGQREGLVVVAAQEVVEAGAQLLKHHADVAAVVKPLLQVHALAAGWGVEG